MLDKEDVWDAHHDKIKCFFDFVVKNSFPNSRIQTSESWGSPTQPPNSFKGIVSPENLFIGTKYEFPQNSDLLHFTNINGLLSILNTGFFRLSEFKNFEDKSEFYYSSSYLNQNIFKLYPPNS